MQLTDNVAKQCYVEPQGEMAMGNTLTPVNTEKARRICINPVDNGYIVEVGCKTFVFESQTKLIELLTTYLSKPAETEKKFFAGELFK